MPERSTLDYIADIVIRRTIDEVGRGSDLVRALERVYPFPDGDRYRDIWGQALKREGIVIVPFSAGAIRHRKQRYNPRQPA